MLSNKFLVNKNSFFALLMSVVVLSSCDDTTDTIGSSLTDVNDMMNISTEEFYASTEPFIVDDVVCRSASPYLGKLKDPETNSYITEGYMTQFYTLSGYLFPEIDSLANRVDGKIIADSCEVIISYRTYTGDSLALMKLTLHEMEKPVQDGQTYYSSFDPYAQNLIRTGGIHKSKTYLPVDYNIPYADRTETTYIPNTIVSLNDEYTDKDGNVYNNYGTYIMRKYYENPSSFHNSYTFARDVCPGFYIESSGGVGSLLNIYTTVLNIYYTFNNGEKGKCVSYAEFSGTEEVLQLNTFQQDKNALQSFIDSDNTCSYLKTPAGIFTKVELPVDDIMRDKTQASTYALRTDTVNIVKLTVGKLNNKVQSSYSFATPSTILVLPVDSMQNFFVQKKIADYRTSFLYNYSSSTNGYTFSNVSTIVDLMAKTKKAFYDANKDKNYKDGTSWSVDFDKKYAQEFPDWNKVAMVPVKVSNATAGSTTVVSKVTNYLAPTSARIEGGIANKNSIKVSVIYSKFNK